MSACQIPIAVGLLAASCVFAQPASKSVVPDVLKDMKQAGSMCMRDDPVPGNTGAAADPVAPDLSCAIAPKELAALLGNPNTTPIDVRSPAEYERVRIAGALNATVSSLRTKEFLRDKTIVLVGNGKAERELYRSCAALRSQGFKSVRVLRGGIPSWLSTRQAAVGTIANEPNVEGLSASELWIESQFASNLVLVARGQAEIQGKLPASMLIADESAEAVKKAIERRRRETKNAPVAAVVLVASPTTTVDSLQRARDGVQPTPLLVYSDTPAAYTRYLTQQAAVWVAQARGPKKLPCGL